MAALRHADSQDTWTCALLLQWDPLNKGLVEDGFTKEAMVMRIIGDASQAFEKEGITHEDRTARIQRRTDFLTRLMNNRQYDPVHHTTGHEAGLSRELINAWLCNGNARRILLARYPDLEYTLCERAMGTDTVEMIFSRIMVISSNIKRDMATCVAIITNVVRLWVVQRQTGTINVPLSAGKRYSAHKQLGSLKKWFQDAPEGRLLRHVVYQKKLKSDSDRKSRNQNNNFNAARDQQKLNVMRQNAGR
jgi:hypothetical protein